MQTIAKVTEAYASAIGLTTNYDVMREAVSKHRLDRVPDGFEYLVAHELLLLTSLRRIERHLI